MIDSMCKPQFYGYLLETAYTSFLTLLNDSAVAEINNLIDDFCVYSCTKKKLNLSMRQKFALLKILTQRNVEKKILDNTNEKLLQIETDPELRNAVQEFIENAVPNGNLQLPVMKWAIKNGIISSEILQYALLIGYDNAKTLKKQKNFEYSSTIELAISWKNNEAHWRRAVERLNLTDKDQTVRYSVFCRNIRQFGLEDKPYKVVKAHIQRYIAGEIEFVNLHEIAYHKIAECPKSKDDIIEVMRESQLSQAMIDEIRSIDSTNANPIAIPNIKCEDSNKLSEIQKSYLELDPKIPVYIVSQNVHYENLITVLEQVSESDYPFVAFDMVSNSHSIRPENQVKYLQLAVKNAVYLVKITRHNSSEYDKLCAYLLCNERLTKIGFATSKKSDLRTFVKTGQKDVRDLRKEIGRRNLPSRKSELCECEKLFGKPINESEKRSVWSREPLRQAQIQYAAIDVYCLLMIRDKMDNDNRSVKRDKMECG